MCLYYLCLFIAVGNSGRSPFSHLSYPNPNPNSYPNNPNPKSNPNLTLTLILTLPNPNLNSNPTLTLRRVTKVRKWTRASNSNAVHVLIKLYSCEWSWVS